SPTTDTSKKVVYNTIYYTPLPPPPPRTCTGCRSILPTTETFRKNTFYTKSSPKSLLPTSTSTTTIKPSYFG
ncbi:hypothetical protein BB560_004989, partial [Smittium megazygosporum]